MSGAIDAPGWPGVSPGALREVRRLAGPRARIDGVVRLQGGQEADTWRIDTVDPRWRVVVREYPAGDPGAAREQAVLRTLDGLGGLAPRALGADLDGRWSQRPTSLIGWLNGVADITPSRPRAWAAELGRGLAVVHTVPAARLADLPGVFDRETPARLSGPLAPAVRARWSQLGSAPVALSHSDYWSGNVVWHDRRLTGIVDWSGGARGPRGYDIGWCRLDLVLLYDAQLADVFLDAYRRAGGDPPREIELWDAWALARSQDAVTTWAPNYAPLGRGDLNGPELRRRHARWTELVRAGALH